MSWISPPVPARVVSRICMIGAVSTYLPTMARFDGAADGGGFSIIDSTSMADFAKGQGIKRVAIVALDNEFGRGLTSVFRRQFESKSREIVETFDIDEGNAEALDEVVAKLKELQPEGIYIVETAGRNPVQYMERLKGANIKVIHKCTSVRFAKKAESIGCDYVSIDGCECAGHPGEEDITSLILIPRTVDQIGIPVIASGGFADGRGLIAALALGAGAINMGTRFVATVESPVHQNVKDWLVRAGEGDTTYVLRSLRNTERVLKNSVAEKVVALEAQGAGIEELAPLVSGKNGLKVLSSGDIEAGLCTAGLCVGLVNDIPTVAELIERIVSDAEEILEKGFPG